MNRRTFLTRLTQGAALVAAAATGVVSAEELWTPGKRTYFLPPKTGWMGGPHSMADITEQYLHGLMSEQRGFDWYDGMVKDAAKALADKIDKDALALYGQFVSAAEFNAVGCLSPGSYVIVNKQTANLMELGLVDGSATLFGAPVQVSDVIPQGRIIVADGSQFTEYNVLANKDFYR